MKSHYCEAEKTTIDFVGECNWCGEKEMNNKDTLKIVNDALKAVKLMNREWQGLTDDEIDKVYYKTFDTWSSEVDIEFARAIEQALKEKNATNN